MKLSVDKAKLTGFWARNCATIQLVWILKFARATIQLVWILKFAVGPEK